MIRTGLFVILLVVGILLVPSALAQEKTGSIEVFIKSENNDRIVPVGLSIKIFKDLETVPLKEVTPLETNPTVISGLPMGHRYKVEVYMNSMYAGVGYADLQKSQDKMEITIKNAGGMRMFWYGAGKNSCGFGETSFTIGSHSYYRNRCGSSCRRSGAGDAGYVRDHAGI